MGEGAEAQRATAYTPNSLNQYDSMTVGTGSPVPFTHDEDGNLVQLDGKISAYDGENRLIAYAPAAPAEGDKKIAFLYDYLGRRVKRETYAYASGLWTKTEERRYVYDGWNLAQELDGANALVRSYVWGLDLSQTPQGAGGVGGLLASVEGTTIYHYFHDANGNVGQLVKSSPFGNTTWQSSPLADSNPFRFSTKYNDTVSGLYYYGYRYYAPTIGRWVNRDPIGELGSSVVRMTQFRWRYDR
jgi:RHS repeat-associated protein